jgi:hypothetical protein
VHNQFWRHRTENSYLWLRLYRTTPTVLEAMLRPKMTDPSSEDDQKKALRLRPENPPLLTR